VTPLFVDEHLIVVDKPSGLLSVPGKGPDKADCAAARVQASYPDALVVHRLDQATSGLLLFARGLAAQRRLSRAFETREVQKCYLAVVDGLLADDEGLIDLPLAPDWPQRPRQRVDHAHGKPAQTRWCVLSRDTPALTSRVELRPLTGRTHQLRLHLQAIGHAMLGDALYAPPEVLARSPRLLLHAWQLRLPHPGHGAPFEIEAVAPF